MRTNRSRPQRSGTVVVLALCLMVTMLVFVAFAVDIGYLNYVHTELQRTADAAASAATWRLLEYKDVHDSFDEGAITGIRSTAGEFAGYNAVANKTVALTEGDTVVGQLPYPFSSASAMSFDDPTRFNAVRVRVRKAGANNGDVPLFFARILGVNGCAMEEEATAAFLDGFDGFRVITPGDCVDFLPIALDEGSWLDAVNGIGPDGYSWDPATRSICQTNDGVKEVNLYPNGVGVPGNRGTVDVGSNNNSTADIARQILHGVSYDDLQYHGGCLALDNEGKLYLNGDTGISAGVKDELASIVGQKRMIPLFRTVVGPGNNATYTIVGFGAVRILYVKLTGSPSSKQVLVQPTCMTIKGGIPSTRAGRPSYFIYSPVWLVR